MAEELLTGGQCKSCYGIKEMSSYHELGKGEYIRSREVVSTHELHILSFTSEAFVKDERESRTYGFLE
jgi:hypothetical protein